jgi:mRNA-degrading endonuclease RelE of RelBE toxin-antitoxin system
MYHLIYSKEARDDLSKIDHKSRKRIIEKLDWFAASQNVFAFSKKIAGFSNKYHRLRIGHYRAIFSIDDNGIIHVMTMLHIQHRRRIYKTNITG